MISKKTPSFLHTFLKGEVVSAFWSFISKGIGLVNTFLTISSLTLYQYGVFQLLLSIAGMSSDAVNLGGAVVSNEMSRAIGENRPGDAKKIFKEYTILRLFVALILWAAVFFGATIFFNNYDIDFIKDMRIISFLFITEAIFMIMRMYWLVKLEFGVVAKRSTINKLIQFFILIFFFVQGDLGLKQLLWSIIVASSLSVLYFIPRFIRSYKKWNNVVMPQGILLGHIIYNYGSWEIVRQFINKITFRIKPWIIKLFIGTEAVAIFSIAEMIVTSLQDILPSKTLQSLVPLWIKDKYLSIKMFSYGIKYYVLTGIFIALVSLIIVPPVVHFFFPKYNESLKLYYVMILNLPIFAAGIIAGNYLIAFRKQKFIFLQHITRNIVSLGIIILTIPYIGLWGLALEFVLIPLFMLLSNYFYTKNEDKGFYFDWNIITNFKQEDKDILTKIVNIIRGWLQRKDLSQKF